MTDICEYPPFKKCKWVSRRKPRDVKNIFTFGKGVIFGAEISRTIIKKKLCTSFSSWHLQEVSHVDSVTP